jgi:tetratricopeptide (TPR) repeat protein
MRVSSSGVVASGHVTLIGTYVAGRDLTIHLPPPPEITPFQLPADIEEFTGRDSVMAGLCEWLSQERPGRAVVISAIAGRAGVGKTALVVHVAHQIKDEFLDGQLYVNLRGYEKERLDPAEVLAEFLRDLGIPGTAIPASLDGRQKLFRSRLHGRKALVVLDNAASEAQVRPLLPGSPTCAVLVTSRSRLLGLDGVRRVDLEVLSTSQAVELLRKISGRELIGADAKAAEEVARLCGFLPLSVRIAGARLASRSSLPIQRLAERLADERGRLRELVAGDLDVRVSFGYSYNNLHAEDRRAFRLLGLLTGAEFAAWSAAAVLRREPDMAEEQLDRLVDAQLLDVARYDDAGQVRYRFHDLLRVYAREQVEQETAEARSEAVGTLLATASRLVERADAALWPDGSRRYTADALAVAVPAWTAKLDCVVDNPAEWLTAERSMLVAAVRQAFDERRYEITTALANVLARFLQIRGHLSEWEQVQLVALDAANRAGHLTAEATTLRGLGELYRDQGRWRDAESAYLRAIAHYGELRDEHGFALTKLSTGVVMRDQSRWSDAIACYQWALPVFRRLGDRHAYAATLREMGISYRDQARWPDAIRCYEEALPIFRDLDDRRWEAATQREIGVVYSDQGLWEEALGCFRQALPAFNLYGDRLRVAYLLREFAVVHCLRNELAMAWEELDQAQLTFDELDDRRGWAQCAVVAAEIHLQMGRAADAIAVFDRACAVFEGLSDRRWLAMALGGKATALLTTGDLIGARSACTRALTVFEELGDHRWHAIIRVYEGDVLRCDGQPQEAADRYNHAIRVFQDLGDSRWAASVVERQLPK